MDIEFNKFLKQSLDEAIRCIDTMTSYGVHIDLSQAAKVKGILEQLLILVKMTENN